MLLFNLHFAQLRASFINKITETCNTLNINASIAMILLLTYDWNDATLIGDCQSLMKVYPILNHCVIDMNIHTVENVSFIIIIMSRNLICEKEIDEIDFL